MSLSYNYSFFFCQVRSPFSSWDDRPRSPHPTPTLPSFTLSLPPTESGGGGGRIYRRKELSRLTLSLSLSLSLPEKKQKESQFSPAEAAARIPRSSHSQIPLFIHTGVKYYYKRFFPLWSYVRARRAESVIGVITVKECFVGFCPSCFFSHGAIYSRGFDEAEQGGGEIDR